MKWALRREYYYLSSKLPVHPLPMANLTLFAQIISLLPKEKIRKIIKESGTDKHCKGYNTWSQFVSMVFSQFSGSDSVRDVSNGLKSATGNLNHIGISRAPSKSTIAYQNANRDSGVFRRIFYGLFQYFGLQACWLAQRLPVQNADKVARLHTRVIDPVGI